MEDESGWWFAAYLAIPAGFAAMMFRVLERFLEQMAEAAGTDTSSPASPGSSFAVEQFPQELLTGVRILTLLLLAYAVLGMAASLYLDSRWVTRHSEDWQPNPPLYTALGLVPGVSTIVALYYLARRYDSVGIAGINAPRPPSVAEASESRWWVVLLVSATAIQAAVTAILAVQWLQIIPDGLVYFITSLTIAIMISNFFLAVGVPALVVDAKRIESSGAWKPRPAAYIAVMLVLPVLALPTALVYLYRRRNKIGF